ncbi:MAG: hypothetical protein AAGF89_08840 [Bacteroidota bacterium]
MRFLILCLFLLPTIVFAQSTSDGFHFHGRYLIAVSDADMVPSAYEDGKLGPRQGNDAVSVIPLLPASGKTSGGFRAHSIEVTNSVAGPPSVIASTSDGRWAFIIETFSPRPGLSDGETFADFKLGTTLTVLDLAAPTKPKLHQQLTILPRPLSVSVSPDDKTVAVSYHPGTEGNERPVSLHPFTGGQLGEATFPMLPGWSPTDELSDVEWHPSRPVLAAVNKTADQVHFYEYTGNGMRAWGNVVKVGKYPFIGRFTADGNHFLTNCLYWGSDVNGTWSSAPRGSINNIKLAAFVREGAPVHSLTAQLSVGASPEGFAVSPNGRYVATINMERSWLLPDDARKTWFSTISLLEREPESGSMEILTITPYYGMLPEMAVFDASGQNLAVVCSDQFNDRIPGSALDFFRIVRDPLNQKCTFLVQTRRSVALRHGAHDLILVE